MGMDKHIVLVLLSSRAFQRRLVRVSMSSQYAESSVEGSYNLTRASLTPGTLAIHPRESNSESRTFSESCRRPAAHLGNSRLFRSGPAEQPATLSHFQTSSKTGSAERAVLLWHQEQHQTPQPRLSVPGWAIQSETQRKSPPSQTRNRGKGERYTNPVQNRLRHRH